MTAPHSVTPQTKGKILVVDDEHDIREGLELLLLSEGYSVDLAQNGTEGIQKLESATYDLALLDLMMPDMSGMDVLAEVRKRDRETPIFMITAYGSVERAVEAIKAGANDYFSKPWDNEKLIIEIDRMIAGRRLETENAPWWSATAFRTSSAAARAWCACSTWWVRWPPAAPLS